MRALLAASLAALAACSAEGGAILSDALPRDASDATSEGDATTSEDAVADTSPIFETDPGCETGHVKCGGDCVDLSSNGANCGACGNACGPKETCAAGKCELACAAPTTKCGDKCVDLSSDGANCGACGNACGAKETCAAGKCELVCAAPTSKCGDKCVDLKSDGANCGSCGNACAASYTCTDGTCVAPVTTVTFPSTGSATKLGALGGGGGGRFYQTGDYVQETFARTAPVTKLTLDFKMSDWTNAYCFVGTLSWSVLVNGTTVGTYSWTGGSGSYADKPISQTYSFGAIAPSGGAITLRIQALNTVCPGAGSWNWYAGGSAKMQ